MSHRRRDMRPVNHGDQDHHACGCLIDLLRSPSTKAGLRLVPWGCRNTIGHRAQLAKITPTIPITATGDHKDAREAVAPTTHFMRRASARDRSGFSARLDLGQQTQYEGVVCAPAPSWLAYRREEPAPL